jgi:hypothetical protein
VSVVVESADLLRLVSPHLVGDTDTDAEVTPLLRTITRLAHVSSALNTQDSARRFLWRLKINDAVTTTSQRAEEVLLAVDEPSAIQELPHFFTTLRDAREAAQAHYADQVVDPIEIRELAHALYSFSKGYVEALNDDPALTERRERENALRRQRVRARKQRELEAMAA